MRTDRLQREFSVQLRWTVSPLHPETPEEGMELAELFAGREGQVTAMQTRLLRIADAEGLPMIDRNRTCNGGRAQELGKWAEEKGQGDPFRQKVYRAFFVERRNIALPDVLARVADAVGLAGDEARGFSRRGALLRRSMPTGNGPGNWGSPPLRLTFVPEEGWWDSAPTRILSVSWEKIEV